MKLDSDYLINCVDGTTHRSSIMFTYDKYAVKYMVGHSITDITEKVYTKREADWLKTEMQKIK